MSAAAFGDRMTPSLAQNTIERYMKHAFHPQSRTSAILS